MKRYLLILHKWSLVLSLFLIPYYIHSARIDRILNNYTQKSNAIYLTIPVQKSDVSNSSFTNDIILQTDRKIEQIFFVIFLFHINNLKSFSQSKILYINADIPPPYLI